MAAPRQRRHLPASKELECPVCGNDHPAFSCAGVGGDESPLLVAAYGGQDPRERVENEVRRSPALASSINKRPATCAGNHNTRKEYRQMVMAAQELNAQSVGEIIERVVMLGDLKQLKPEERVEYYAQVCRSLGLNPLTRPLEYITLNGKLTLYARKDCTEQLRKLHRVSIYKLETNERDGVFEAMAYARSGDREDIDFGAASIKGLTGDALVNAKLKAITKAKRRVTLSICGLGFLDETEIETVPQVQVVDTTASDGPIPMITRDQRKHLNDFIGGLKVKFNLTNEELQDKMNRAVGVTSCNALTQEQAEEMIGIYAVWLNQLEEDAAAAVKKEVPF